VEGRKAAVRGRCLRRHERPRAVLHRRPAQARRRDLRVREPDDQQLPPPGPGYEAPVNLAYSARNRSATIRIPLYPSSPKAKRLELRSPDPSCNPYLAFAAMMMAGLDGIENRIHPGEPLDKDIYSLSPEELAEVPTVPGSLDASLDALHADRGFLMK